MKLNPARQLTCRTSTPQGELLNPIEDTQELYNMTVAGATPYIHI